MTYLVLTLKLGALLTVSEMQLIPFRNIQFALITMEFGI